MAYARMRRSSESAPATQRSVRRRRAPTRPALLDRRLGLGDCAKPRIAALRTTPVLQAKLEVGPPNDRFEQEADRVADQVMRMADPLRADATSLAGKAADHLQRMCAACDEEVRRAPPGALQTKRGSDGTGLQAEMRGLRGRGQPLSPALRAFFEPRFGHDFSRVRIHRDARSAELAQSVNAKAFTFGWSIVLGNDHHAENTLEHRRLLAHELTHVIQQGGSGSSPSGTSTTSPSAARDGHATEVSAITPLRIARAPDETPDGTLPASWPSWAADCLFPGEETDFLPVCPSMPPGAPFPWDYDKCPVLPKGTLSEVSWGESASMYPTKSMNPTAQELYHPENWDIDKKCELLKARGAMHALGQRNEDVQRGSPVADDVIHERMTPYHLAENFPSLDSEIADANVKWFFHDPSPTAVHPGIHRGDPEKQVRVKAYGPFYNSYGKTVPKGPVYILFYKEKQP